MDHPDDRIVQIMPAPGWRAVFSDDKGMPVIFEVACWALHAGGYVSAQYSDCDGNVQSANDENNFVGIIEPSDQMEGVEIIEWVKRWAGERRCVNGRWVRAIRTG